MTVLPTTATPTAPLGSTTQQQAASATGSLNQLDNSQTFLQLLVAQLKNQDPLNPSDPTSFMTEIAQLTAVQSQTSLSSEEQTVAADSMIGLTVTGAEASGASLTGQVTGVLLSQTGAPTLEVQDSSGKSQNVALTSVTSVTKS